MSLDYPMPEITAIAEHGEDDFTFTYTYDEQPVTESDTTWTEPAGTFVMTISDGHLGKSFFIFYHLALSLTAKHSPILRKFMKLTVDT